MGDLNYLRANLCKTVTVNVHYLMRILLSTNFQFSMQAMINDNGSRFTPCRCSPNSLSVYRRQPLSLVGARARVEHAAIRGLSNGRPPRDPVRWDVGRAATTGLGKPPTCLMKLRGRLHKRILIELTKKCTDMKFTRHKNGNSKVAMINLLNLFS